MRQKNSFLEELKAKTIAFEIFWIEFYPKLNTLKINLSIFYLAEDPGEVDDKWGTAIWVGTP